MTVFADRGALGTMCASVERMVEGGFLTGPDAILNFGDNSTTDCAMRTNGFDSLRLRA